MEHIILTEQAMTGRILTEEIYRIAVIHKEAASNGEVNLLQYGTAGIRGEAVNGYPAVVRHALPVMRQGIREKRDWNLVKLQTLLTLMSIVEDSNVLYRQNPETLNEMHREAEDFLAAGGAYGKGAAERLKEMDRLYIEKNISPGGCADSLAVTVFLYLVTEGGMV